MADVDKIWEYVSVPLFPTTLVNFLPNLAFTVCVGLLVGALASPRLGLNHRAKGALWLACLLVPLAYTLSATGGEGVAGCQIGLFPWGTRAALLSVDTRANLLMLMPAGAAALMFPSGPRRLAALTTALALPVAIEMTQMLVRPLRRACQGADIFNNSLGVLLGFWLVAGLWTLWVALSGKTGRVAPAAGSSDPKYPLGISGRTPHQVDKVSSSGP